MSDGYGFLLFLWIVGAPAVGLLIDAYVYRRRGHSVRGERRDEVVRRGGMETGAG